MARRSFQWSRNQRGAPAAHTRLRSRPKWPWLRSNSSLGARSLPLPHTFVIATVEVSFRFWLGGWRCVAAQAGPACFSLESRQGFALFKRSSARVERAWARPALHRLAVGRNRRAGAQHHVHRDARRPSHQRYLPFKLHVTHSIAFCTSASVAGSNRGSPVNSRSIRFTRPAKTLPGPASTNVVTPRDLMA